MKKLLLAIYLYFLPVFLRAKEFNPDGKIAVPIKGFEDITFFGFFEVILEGITIIAVPILVLAFIYSGFSFVRAQGDPGKIEEAKKIFGWIIMGAFIILGSNVILALVSDTADAILK